MPFITAIREIEAYLNKVEGKKITKDNIQLCAGNHMNLMSVIERNRSVKGLTYYIRYIAKCEPSESDKIIQYFREKGYAVNEYSRSGQPEIVVLF